MKINLYVEDLQKAITKAEKVMMKKATLLVLENIKLTAKKEGITVTATNLESEIHINIDGEVEQEGTVLINSDSFKLIQKLNGRIHMILENNILEILSKRELKLKCDDIECFPEDNKLEINEHAFIIEANEFKAMTKIKVASAQDNIRFILNSICIHNNLAWAVDGCRAIQYKLNIDNKCSKDIPIPLKAINELDKIIDKKNAELLTFTYYTDNIKTNRPITHLQVKGKDFRFITRLPEGEYINLNNVIPKEFKNNIIMESEIIKESLDFASGIAKDDKIPVIFNIENKDVTISRTSQTKEMNEKLNCGVNAEDNLRIGFNITYLTDTFKILNSNKVKMQMGTSISPMVITDIEDDKELHLVLPVRIKTA